MTSVEEARKLAETVVPAKTWSANGKVLQQIVVVLTAPFVPLYQALPAANKPAFMGSIQAAVFAFFQAEDDRLGWQWPRMTDPTEDAFYKALSQAKVQEILTGRLQMDRPA